MSHLSPISLDLPWYEAGVDERARHPMLERDMKADVVVVGGGFTGVSAAAHLALAGVDVALVEAHRLGAGASGRNGGQLGTGQRAWPEQMEVELGLERARTLFDLGEEAKAHLLAFADEHDIAIDYVKGHMSVVHKPRHLKDYRAHAEIMASRFGYAHLAFMDRDETAARLGSTRYFGGLRDSGTGHIHPLKLLVGTARVAAVAGARIFERTAALAIEATGGKVRVRTAHGTITAEKCLVAANAHIGDLEPLTAAHVMSIGSFIGATEPLGAGSSVLPGGESVEDSRFVVRYFRRTRDGRLLFGGREIYSAGEPGDIAGQIRRQIAQVYPALARVPITHAWGGQVGITLPRRPFVREVMPNVVSAGGYSGHGVMLANFTGRLYAEAVAGKRERLRLLEDLAIPPFPGGRRLRPLLLFLALNWYALRDRI